VEFSLHWMLVGLTLAVLGLHGFYVGALSRIFFDYSGRDTRRWLRLFSYTRSVLVSVLAAAVGVALSVPLVITYARSGLRLYGVFAADHMAVTGLLLVIAGAMNFTFTLALHAAAAHLNRRHAVSGSAAP